MSALVRERQNSGPSLGDTVESKRNKSEEVRNNLERKRATDRKSQQAARARTKARITQLEEQVAALTAVDGPKSLALLSQLQVQCAENSRLRNIVRNINELSSGIAAVLEPGDAKDPAEPSHAQQTTTSQLHADNSADLMVPMGSEHSPQGVSASENRATAAREPRSSRTTGLECGEGERDYFKIMNSAITMMESCMQLSQIPGVEVDQDINVRAVTKGWDAVASRHDLDIGWQILQDLDQGLFQRCGDVERIAIMRMMRSMLLSSVDGLLSTERKPPAYMNRTQAQIDISHLRLIDYFAWPVVRDYFVLNGIDFAPENVASQFALDTGFRWPFEINDMFKCRTATGLYSFSREFDEAFHVVESWYFKSDVMASILPPLISSTSQTQPPAQPLALPLGERRPETASTSAASINDILNLSARWMDASSLPESSQ